MDDATQKLVDEARRWAGGSTTSPVGANLVQDLADALEAAYDQMESFVEAGLLSRVNGQYEPSASMIAALEATQRPPVNPVVEAIDAARDSIARGELASVVIDTDDYPQRPPVSVPYVTDEGTLHRHSYGEECNYLSCRPVSLEVREAIRAVFRAGWEAAQRPPVSPEVREEVAKVVSSAMIRTKTDTPYGVTDALLARFSVPSRLEVSPEAREGMRDALREAHQYDHDFDPEWDYTEDDDRYIDALLARFTVPSQPVYDEEKIAFVVYGETGCQMHLARSAAAALVAALPGLTKEESRG